MHRGSESKGTGVLRKYNGKWGCGRVDPLMGRSSALLARGGAFQAISSG